MAARFHARFPSANKMALRPRTLDRRSASSTSKATLKYDDVVFAHIEGRHESILYVEVKYVDVVYVNMRHEVARTERGRNDVIDTPTTQTTPKKYERSKKKT